MTKRTCGDCAACCRLIGVVAIGGPIEFEKPPHTPCPHGASCGLSGSCKVYDLRPQPCRDYQCAWLGNEWIPDELRPDRCGVLFELDTSCREVCCAITDDMTKLAVHPVPDLIWHLNRLGLTVFVMGPGPDIDPMMFLAPDHDAQEIVRRLFGAGVEKLADLERRREAFTGGATRHPR